jgi:hypothetical protein
LIWGDKKFVLPSLVPEFSGKVKLIYIDPPFDTGADFSYQAQIHESDEQFKKEPSILEQKAYRDTWGKGLDSYLHWFDDTVACLYDLLAPDGSIFVHLDWRVGHYAKVILDSRFGVGAFKSPDAPGFRNEIAWCYQGPGSPGMKQFNRKHDTIFWYSKSSQWTFNDHEIRVAHHEKTVENFRRGLSGSGFAAETYDLHQSGKIPEDWWVMAIAARYPIDGVFRSGYPTEKPWPLIERIIKAASNNDDIVLDCFCGGGTTAAVAEKLGRRWITCDLGRFAIHTARKRLLSMPDVKPFVVQNLGKYERQAWQIAEFKPEGAAALEEQRLREAAYREFILDLYHATPLNGHTWLHGVKSGRAVHIGAVDAPVTISDVRAISREVWKATNVAGDDRKAAVDILGWDFALELNETARQIAAEAKVDVAFKRIPREVLEKKAVDQGEIKFFELGALAVDAKLKGKSLTLALTDFLIPIDDVPEEVRKEIKNWSQMIDYWAVDWDFKDDTFHNQWQSYRTRQSPKLDLSGKFEYEASGVYRVMVKVIDILGNDTTKTLEIKVK